MSINGIDGAGGSMGSGPIRSGKAQEADGISSGSNHGSNGRTASTGDRVEISATARALSAVEISPNSEVGPAAQNDGLSAERIQAVLTRVQDGFYDSPQVQEATAQSLLSDLQTL